MSDVWYTNNVWKIFISEKEITCYLRAIYECIFEPNF